MNSETVMGVEYCPFCEGETEFDVPEDIWIVNCSECGRPILLCDKCFTMFGQDRNCAKCPYERSVKREMRKWEMEQIGKIVRWNDPDGGICSGYYKVKSFRDNEFVLAPIVIDENGLKEDGSLVETFGSELEYMDEAKQVDVLVRMFSSVWKV